MEIRLVPNASSADRPHAVDGLPLNQTALIMRLRGRWSILRTIDDNSSGWHGSFDSADDALTALVAELSRDKTIEPLP